MNHLLFFDCIIDDCVFDNSVCQHWGLWGTTVTNSSWRDADLRNSALGAVKDGQRNSFRQVDFTKADLRGTSYTATEFIGCTFKDTRLDKVDFQTSTFTDCTFEGELREVLFYRTGFKGEGFPANEMTNVEFTRAQLRWAEFRGLDMDSVQFPEDEEHIIVCNYMAVLDQLVQEFGKETDIASRKLANDFRMARKWAGVSQRRGVFNKNDLLETGGEEGLRRVLATIEQMRSKP
jgi:hypothetical protein